MNYFPNSEEEIDLIRFLAQYQYLKVKDAKYFFKSKLYYRNRINNLISKKYIRKIKLNLVLDKQGIEYVKLLNAKYNRLNRDKKYLPRLLFISNFGAYFHKSNTVKFTPSFNMKDKEMFTITARRFIGVLEINKIDYLIYRISEDQEKQYISSVIYDIQKERQYKNIIVLVDNIQRINIDDFSFGMNQVLIIEDNERNREKIKYINSIRWSEIINDYYNNKVFLAEYNFCDYTNYKDKYVSTFYNLDSEKIARIKYFLRENKNKNIDIICDEELKGKIEQQLPDANYIIVDFENYINKERNIYD